MSLILAWLSVIVAATCCWVSTSDSGNSVVNYFLWCINIFTWMPHVKLLLLTICIPLWPQFTHLSPPGTIMHHVIKQTSHSFKVKSPSYESCRTPLGCGGTGFSAWKSIWINLQFHHEVMCTWSDISKHCILHHVESMPWRGMPSVVL